MKKCIAILLVCGLLMLCGCGKESAGPTGTTAAKPATTSSVEVHRHNFTDADCTTPKTCVDCGLIRGEPLGHDPGSAVCSRCGYEDKSFVDLQSGSWQLDSLHNNGLQLSVVKLTFQGNRNAVLEVRTYVSLDELDESMQEQYPDEFLYDYSGTIYAFTGNIQTIPLEYSTEGITVSCQSTENAHFTISFTLERTSGTRLALVFYEGAAQMLYWQVGDILVSSQLSF